LFRELLAQHIKDGIGDGSITPEVNPQIAALALIGQLRGTAMLVCSTARDMPIAEVSAEVARNVGRSLAAQD
jgi:hypothetical protein